jgi:hypothetical protein
MTRLVRWNLYLGMLDLQRQHRRHGSFARVTRHHQLPRRFRD